MKKEINNEARKWLKNNGCDYCFAGNRFDSKKNALLVVNNFYRLGVASVQIDNILEEEWRIKEKGGPYADTLIVTLPKSMKKQVAILLYVIDLQVDDAWFDKKKNALYLWWD